MHCVYKITLFETDNWEISSTSVWYNGYMSGSQLPLFQRKTYKGIIPTIPVELQAPGAEKTVIETLPAYYVRNISRDARRG
jgi:hypothetical protein